MLPCNRMARSIRLRAKFHPAIALPSRPNDETSPPNLAVFSSSIFLVGGTIPSGRETKINTDAQLHKSYYRNCFLSSNGLMAISRSYRLPFVTDKNIEHLRPLPRTPWGEASAISPRKLGAVMCLLFLHSCSSIAYREQSAGQCLPSDSD